MRTKIILLLLLILCGVSCVNRAYAQKYWNTAAHVSGSGYVAVIPTQTVANLSGSFTYECWFNATISGGATLFGKNGARMLLFGDNGYVRGRMQTNNNARLNTRASNSLTINTWFHLACTYDSTTDVMRFYINGNLDTSATTPSGPLPGTDSLFIGNSTFGGSPIRIDDVKIWDYARTAAEIRDNIRQPYGGAVIYSTSLILHQGFDNPQSGPFTSLNLYDGYNSFINRGASAVDIGKRPSTTLFGNSALKVDGAGDYMRMKTHADVELAGPMTIEVWIYPDTIDANNRYILAKKGGWNHPGYALYYQNGKIRCKFNGGGSFNDSDIPVKKWTHYAVTVSNTGYCRFYINGKPDGESNIGLPLANTDSLYIGGFPLDNGYFKGYVDAVKISNHEKTPSAVQSSIFEMVDYTNLPSAPNSTVSINFDYNCLYNSYSGVNGGSYLLIGNANISKPNAIDKTPVSPVIAANVPNFPEGYTIKATDRRVPEFNTAGYMKEDTVNFSSSMTISDLNLYIALNHEYQGDLKIQLFSPQGDSLTIWDQDAVSGTQDHMITVFDDQADTGLNYYQVDFGPRIKPQSSLNTKFLGENSLGNWRLRITDYNNGNTGYLYSWGIQVNNQTLVGVEGQTSEVPKTYKLEQNYPNPFNPVTKIKYSVPQTSIVKLRVYDILGKNVATLVNGAITAGTHSAEFTGHGFASGVYYYEIEVISPRDGYTYFREVKKMVLIK